MRSNAQILPSGGGKVEVAFGVNAITLTVTGPLAPGATGVTLTRDNAEAVVRALTTALARLRGTEAMPAAAEPLEAAHKRPSKKVAAE